MERSIIEHSELGTGEVEHDAAPCSSKRAVNHRVVEFDTIIHGDGRIEIGPINDEDFALVKDKIMAIVTSIAGNNPIGFSDCLDPQRVEAVARALAARTLGGTR